MENNKEKRVLIVCTTDSMITNFLIPHINELKNKGFTVECACSRTGPFFDVLTMKHGLIVHDIGCSRSPFSLKTFSAYKKLLKIIKNGNFHILFCHEPVGGLLGRLAGHKLKTKVVYMAHGFHFYKGAPKKRIIYYLVEKFLSRYTDTLVTINKEDYECALHKFYAKKCIKVDGVGVDTSKFVINRTDFLRTELALKQNSLILLSVGELIKRKNHIAIIKSLSKHKDVDLIYAVAGEGKLRKWLSKMINKFGLLRKDAGVEEKKTINHRIYNRNRENCVESGILLEANKVKLIISKKIFKDKYSSKLPAPETTNE